MKVDVLRSTGIQTYEVPPFCTAVKVMDVLDYIYENLDHTLSYYKHSTCNQGICGRCAVKVNGSYRLACVAQVTPDTDHLLLEPVPGGIIKDLVVKKGG